MYADSTGIEKLQIVSADELNKTEQQEVLEALKQNPRNVFEYIYKIKLSLNKYTKISNTYLQLINF